MSMLVVRRWAIVFGALGVAVAGCGTAFTSTSGTTGSGGSGGAGSTTSASSGGGGSSSSTSSSAGGAGGTSSTTGAGGSTTTTTSGSGGTGGVIDPPCTPGDLSTCPPGQYCVKGAGVCAACNAPVSNTFAAPVPLSISEPYPPVTLFPRIGLDGQLLFRFRINQNSEIGFALPVPGAPMSWASATPEPTPLINNPASNEEAPLFLPDGKALIGLVNEKVNTDLPVLLFDSNISGTRQIYATNLPGPVAVPVDLKTNNTSFQIAVAHQVNPPRFWYYSDFFPSPPDTRLGVSIGGEDPVKFDVVLDNGCHARGELMPWVTPDGGWMFLSAPYPDPGNGCAFQAASPSHLFVLPLDGAGLPKNAAKAQPIFPGDPSSRMSPSLSPDQCTLYFSQLEPNGSVMYGAVRK
jgi:hypothetical protein